MHVSLITSAHVTNNIVVIVWVKSGEQGYEKFPLSLHLQLILCNHDIHMFIPA